MYRIFILSFIFLCFYGGEAPLAKNYLIVKNVEVNEVAKNSTIAKKNALESGTRKAFYEIIKKIDSNISNKSLEKVTFKEIQSSIISFSIASEKITRKSYKATLEYVFNQHTLYDLFEKIFKNSKKRNTLIVPILMREENLSIWENDWFYAWSRLPRSNMKVVGEDINTFAYLIMKNISDYNDEMESKLKKQYGVDEVFVVQLEINPSIGDMILTVLNRSLQYSNTIYYAPEKFASFVTKGQILTSIMKDSLGEIDRVNSNYKNNLEVIESLGTKHTVVIKDLISWKYIVKNILNTLNYSVKYISNDIMVVEVNWDGDLQSLHNHLSSYDKVSVLSYTGILEIKKSD